jgi:triacylglycerol lipase
LYDLTTARMQEFNTAVCDVSTVRYASIVGALASDATKVSALLAPGYNYLMKRAGPNDGMVPATSQRWGEVLFEIEADHWAQIGWSGYFDATRCYVAIAEYLAHCGF